MSDTEREQAIRELLRRPYQMVIQGAAEEGFLARVLELPGCITAGETEADALEMLRDAMAAWFESALAHGTPIPEPEQPAKPRYGGRLLVRMSPDLHEQLVRYAEQQGVSANLAAVTLIAWSLGQEQGTVQLASKPIGFRIAKERVGAVSPSYPPAETIARLDADQG